MNDETLFHHAQGKSAEDRAAFLEKACGSDADQRKRIESLLEAHDHPGSFMARPLVNAPATLEIEAREQAGSQPSRPADAEPVGRTIGRYKLLQVIGEGGFGTVYMAEQQEPVRRKVAVKIIKLGMDTRQVVARFEAERQALAMMDHPNIARVFDAGSTDTGRPFFVMELVRGVPITDYCDTNNLSLPQRLDLFVSVCNAVQHAHQKGIIHRDLKPTNVMIAMADGKPIPKVIDFGVAKATNQELTEKTIFTEFRQMVGTPQYMSPEQAEMAGIDIDTRSDVYSLGVLMYELLVGSTPFDPKELRSKAYGEMQRMIREVEPPKPSTRLSTSLDTLPAIAARRRVEPRKLGQLIRGELDWIVMRAMEKDRTRRYESANGLADDVMRYLAGKVVMAAPPGKAYQLSKFVRRNKGPVAAAAAVALVLLFGVTGTTFGLIKAQERLVEANAAKAAEASQRKKAEDNERAASNSALLAQAKEKEARTQSLKSQQVSAFLKEMLAGVAPRTAVGGDTSMLREILDRAAVRVSKSLKDQPEVQAEILSTLAGTYRDLDERVRSEQTMREMLRLRRSIFTGDHRDVADALMGEADALRALSYGDGHEARLREAEAMAREAVAMRERLGGQSVDLIGRTMCVLGQVLELEQKHAESEQVFRRALAIGYQTRTGGAAVQGGLARALRAQGRFIEAIEFHRQEVTILRKGRGWGQTSLIWSLDNFGDTLQASGDLSGAQDAYREALTIAQKYFPANHSTVQVCAHSLIQVYRAQGRSDDAAAVEKQLGESEKAATPLRDLPDVPDGVVIDIDAATPPLPARTSTTNPTTQSLFRTTAASAGDELARHGDFRGAIIEFTKQSDAKPQDSLAIIQIGTLLAEVGEPAAYTEYCSKMLALHAQSRDTAIRRRLSKACLLAPTSSVDTQTAARLVDGVLAGSLEPKFAVQARLAKGLAEYRLGHNAEAIQSMKQAIDNPHDPGSPVTQDLHVAANAIIAAACHKLHRPDQARDALSRATDGFKGRWLGRSVTHLDEDWIDTTVAHILLREARQLIDP